MLLVALLLLPGCAQAPAAAPAVSAAPTSLASPEHAAPPPVTPQQRADAAVLTQDDVGGPDWEGYPVGEIGGVLAGPPEEATDNEACHRGQEASLLEPAPAGKAGSTWSTEDMGAMGLAVSRAFVYSGEEEAREAFDGFRDAATACTGVQWGVGRLESGHYGSAYRQHMSAPTLGDESLGITQVVVDHILGVTVTSHTVAVRHGDAVQLTFFATTSGAAFGGARTAEAMAGAALARLGGAPAADQPKAVTSKAPVALTATQQDAYTSAQAYLDGRPFSRANLVDQLVHEKFRRTDAEIAVDNLEAVGEVDWWEMAAALAAIYLEGGPSAGGRAYTHGALHDLLVDSGGFTPEEAEYGVSMTGL